MVSTYNSPKLRQTLAFHVTESKSLSPQTVGSAVDVHDWLLSEGNPKDLLIRRVCLFDSHDDLIDGLQSRLAESIDLRSRDVTEVDSTANAVRDLLRLLEPLI
jgi:hypothetical protein